MAMADRAGRHRQFSHIFLTLRFSSIIHQSQLSCRAGEASRAICRFNRFLGKRLEF
jgi:hypothetical protein